MAYITEQGNHVKTYHIFDSTRIKEPKRSYNLYKIGLCIFYLHSGNPDLKSELNIYNFEPFHHILCK